MAGQSATPRAYSLDLGKHVLAAEREERLSQPALPRERIGGLQLTAVDAENWFAHCGYVASN